MATPQEVAAARPNVATAPTPEHVGQQEVCFQNRTLIAVLMIIIGVIWYYDLGSQILSFALSPYLGIIVGVYLLWKWNADRQMGQRNPWTLGVGLMILLDSVDQWMGYDFRFIPALIVVVGIVMLLDRGPQPAM
jgi:hypothetical protein